MRAFAGRASPEFNNAAAPLNGGRAEANVKAKHKLTQTLSAYAEYLSSEDLTDGGGKKTAAGVGLRWAATERLTLDGGLRSERETIGTQGNGLLTAPFGSTAGLTGSIGSGSGGGALGFGNQSIDQPPACRSSRRAGSRTRSPICPRARSSRATACASVPATV